MRRRLACTQVPSRCRSIACSAPRPVRQHAVGCAAIRIYDIPPRQDRKSRVTPTPRSHLRQYTCLRPAIMETTMTRLMQDIKAPHHLRHCEPQHDASAPHIEPGDVQNVSQPATSTPQAAPHCSGVLQAPMCTSGTPSLCCTTSSRVSLQDSSTPGSTLVGLCCCTCSWARRNLVPVAHHTSLVIPPASTLALRTPSPHPRPHLLWTRWCVSSLVLPLPCLLSSPAPHPVLLLSPLPPLPPPPRCTTEACGAQRPQPASRARYTYRL